MAATLTSPLVSPISIPQMPPSLHHHLRLHRRRLLSHAASAVRSSDSSTTTWTRSPLTSIEPASFDSSLFHVTADVSDLAADFTAPGQYVQLRIPSFDKPSFLAIASPPTVAREKGQFEFLVKKIAGSTAEVLCGMRSGEEVEVGPVMGRGFDLERIESVDEAETVLIFATGSGISPIRSLIESGFKANKRSDVRLYYGARNLQRMAYQDRFKEWEATGVRILPVLSQPDDRWKGERGYIQAAFARAKQIANPLSTGAVLCGHKQMTERKQTITSIANEKKEHTSTKKRTHVRDDGRDNAFDLRW